MAGTESAAVDVQSAEFLTKLARAMRAEDDEQLKKKAKYDAQALKQVLRPENEFHPDISPYQYPEGGLAHPKPPLHVPMYWAGITLDTNILTPREVELLNQAQPGEYRIKRTDGSEGLVRVIPDKDDLDRVTRLRFDFNTKGSAKQTWPSMVSMLEQIVGAVESPKATADYEVRIAALEAELKKRKL